MASSNYTIVLGKENASYEASAIFNKISSNYGNPLRTHKDRDALSNCRLYDVNDSAVYASHENLIDNRIFRILIIGDEENIPKTKEDLEKKLKVKLESRN